jgi:hypothetical protein
MRVSIEYCVRYTCPPEASVEAAPMQEAGCSRSSKATAIFDARRWRLDLSRRRPAGS